MREPACIQIECALTEKNWSHAFSKKKGRLVRRIYGSFALFVILAGLAIALLFPIVPGFGSGGAYLRGLGWRWLGALIPLLICVYEIWGDRWEAYVVCKKAPQLLAQRQLALSEVGVSLTSVDFSDHWEWTAYKSWAESKNLFVLFQDAEAVTPLPKRFLDSSQTSEVRELLSRKLGSRRKPSKELVRFLLTLIAFYIGIKILLVFLESR